MEEKITFQNEDLTLHGTLTKPDTAGPYPLIIVTHTSSAGTRDFGVYQHLTKILPPCGVAVFLYDRRGSGESTGKFESATFFDLAAAIQTAVGHLKLRSDIDPNHIGLWGMSQGGWIAPLTASISLDVAFVVAVSSVGQTPAEQMNYSAKYQLQEKDYSNEAIRQMLELRGLVDGYYRGESNRPEVQEKLDMFRHEAWFPLAYLDDFLPEKPHLTKWYLEMDYDPIPVMQKINMPVLLLYGERDPWVPIAESIARWKQFGPKSVTVYRIKKANHFMLSMDHSGLRGNEGPMVEQYTAILTQWVKQRLL